MQAWKIEQCCRRRRRVAGGSEGSFLFPPELPGFAGHFPGAPIVPGVVLLRAVRLLAEWGREDDTRAVTGVCRVKFRAAVPPGEEIVISVMGGDFTITGEGGRRIASGRLQGGCHER